MPRETRMPLLCSLSSAIIRRYIGSRPAARGVIGLAIYPTIKRARSLNLTQLDLRAFSALNYIQMSASDYKSQAGTDPSLSNTAEQGRAPPSDSFLDSFAKGISQNKKWAEDQRKANPERMAALSKGQQPEILWIGCSDSRVPETTLLGLQPGEVFVHRNIANIVTSGDLSSAAVIEYAVNALKVKHIVLCGHTGCGGVGAALGNKHIGLIDAWLMPLRSLRYKLHDELENLDTDSRIPRLVRENVLQGVKVIRENPNVLHAQLQGRLQVHGLVYDISTGELEEMNVDSSAEELEKMRRAFKVE